MPTAYRKKSNISAIGRAYQLGWAHGHWFGRCEAAIERGSTRPLQRSLHVLYVATGKGYPYSPLDLGIKETLGMLAAKVTAVEPTADVASVAATVRPDLMIVLDGMNMPLEKIEAVKQLGIRTAVWFTDDPYYTDVTSALSLHYDDVFTMERNCVAFYEGVGCARVHFLPLGVYPGSYRPRNPALGKRSDVCFIGTAYWNRVSLFERVMPLVSPHRLHLTGLWWDRMSSYETWKSRIELGAWLDPDETRERYNANKIVINAHRAHDDETYNSNRAMISAVTPNPRTFEIAACGTLQLTDYREDLAQFYEIDKEIVCYQTAEELAEKIDYYLRHEREREEIALRGLYRTMRDHTYASRLDQLLQLAMLP